MFQALLCPSSGALDYMYAIAAYGAQCLAAGCRGSGAGQQGVRPGRGMLHDMLNMFRALLCPSSGTPDYMGVIAAYGAHCLAAACRRSGAG